MFDVSVVVAGITGAVAVASAIIAWLAQRNVTKLRSELSDREERLRNNLARELASHEAVLRIRGELRMKLFVMAVESIASAKSSHARITNIVVRLARELTLTSDTDDFYELLFAGASFLPPELDPLQDAVVKEVGATIVKLSGSKPEDRKAVGERVLHDFGITMGRFARAAEDWKKHHWDDFVMTDRGAVLRIEEK